jgi:acylphosphatase
VAADGTLEQREVHFWGTVQGVGFRYTARRIASLFKVSGYVRNEPDGEVLLVAEGESAEVDRFLAAVQAEMAGYIERLEQSTGPATGQFRHFDIRF